MYFISCKVNLPKFTKKNITPRLIKTKERIKNPYLLSRKIVFIPEFIEIFSLEPKLRAPIFKNSKITDLQTLQNLFRIFCLFYMGGTFYSNFHFFPFFLKEVSQSFDVWINFTTCSIILWLNFNRKI